MKLYYLVILKNLKEIIDPRNSIKFFFEITKYAKNLKHFKKKYSGNYPLRVLPVLFERNSPLKFDPHYVYQAYWATNKIIKNRIPRYHTDISSSISFVSQLGGFLPVVQLEFSPPDIKISSLKKIAGDLLNLPFSDKSICSLSCLHVIEHVGLGRYGDPLNSNGCFQALLELERILAPEGNLYLSIPIGKKALFFDANYVFEASDIVCTLANLKLVDFSYIDDHGNFIEHGNICNTMKMKYSLGLFHFKRTS